MLNHMILFRAAMIRPGDMARGSAQTVSQRNFRNQRSPIRDLAIKSVVAVGLAIGGATALTATTSMVTAPQAQAFGFGDITGAAKKVGGALKGAAKRVGGDIKNTSKIIGKNAKDWGTSVGAAAKDVGRGVKSAGKRAVIGYVIVNADAITAGKAIGRRAKAAGKKIGRGAIVGGAWVGQCLGHCPIGQDIYVPDTWKSKDEVIGSTSQASRGKGRVVAGRKTTQRRGESKLPPARGSKRIVRGKVNGISAANLKANASRSQTKKRVVSRDRSVMGRPVGTKAKVSRSQTTKRAVSRDRSVMGRPVGKKAKRIIRHKAAKSGPKRQKTTRMQRRSKMSTSKRPQSARGGRTMRMTKKADMLQRSNRNSGRKMSRQSRR